MNQHSPLDQERIAIIGMAGRFPQAQNIEELWRNITEGRECVSFFSEEQVLAEGADAALLRNPRHVRAGGVLEGADLFDASFFGYSPREAELIDPQHRVFLECAWEALEDAGYDAARYRGSIGVFAGASLSDYMLRLQAAGGGIDFNTRIANDKDFVPTRVSYKLNLKGPSLNIQTACSTSLVAVHVACESLLTGACDMALAGGVSIHFPQRVGYLYAEEGILSPDGHCRAFDHKAAGTLAGNGVAIVVLKRLSDAIADRDTIHAVIRGSALNNDGSTKIGFTAPGIDGQAEVIAAAQSMAGVDPDDVTYIEAHGTGTLLGDPIEVAALTQAFRAKTTRRGFCAIGSLKTNIGHLDAAAGAAGLIKTVLALKNRALPPSLHYESPNPQIDFDSSPFYVNTELRPWDTGGKPRIAGVSSFGLGGTNVHVVVEEAPLLSEAACASSWQLLPVSAKSEQALEAAMERLGGHLERHSEQELADVAHTLQLGRKEFSFRGAVVCRERTEAVEVLKSRQGSITGMAAPSPRPVTFLFPGGGAQYANMARGLYESFPVFAEAVDASAGGLDSRLQTDLRAVMFPPPGREEVCTERLRKTGLGLPALFVVEHALAKLWMSLGVRPESMIGHSLGEYAAACISGVLSLEDALALVVERGRLMETVPGGAMLSASITEAEARELFTGRLAVAAVNGPSLVVLSGFSKDIEAAAALFTEKNIEFRRIHVDVAAHSEVLDPIIPIFAACARALRPGTPEIPYISNLTGSWITPEEACDPAYWPHHMRHTVRFGEGLAQLLRDPNRILLETGPGLTLGTLARQHPDRAPEQMILSSIRHPHDVQSDEAVFLNALARLWASGVEIDWEQLDRGQPRRRVSVPTYPFERQRYFVDPRPAGERKTLGKKPNLEEWFYIPSWRRSLPLAPYRGGNATQQRQTYLVFDDRSWLSALVIKRLANEGHDVISVKMGDSYEGVFNNTCSIRPASAEDYQGLIDALYRVGRIPACILHLWSLPDEDLSFEKWQERGYLSLLYLARALDGKEHDTQLVVVASRLFALRGDPAPVPEKATLLGPATVIAQEYPHIRCRVIDLEPDADVAGADRLLCELRAQAPDFAVANRPDERALRAYEKIRLPVAGEPVRALRSKGVYLITGGLGRVGLLLAEYLARTVQARLVLLARSEFPARSEWVSWLEAHEPSDPASLKIRKLLAMEELGAEVLVLRADVADEPAMRDAFAQVEGRFGELHGVLHAAGITSGPSVFHPITEIASAESAEQFRPKIQGTYVLERLLEKRKPDFCLLFSSNASVLGGLGFVAYSAANHFLDSFAAVRGRSAHFPWISSNWDGWLLDEARRDTPQGSSMDEYSMTPAESCEAFRRVVERSTVGQVVISTGDLDARLDLWLDRAKKRTPERRGPMHVRPKLRSNYVAPRDETETEVAQLWREFLGVDQIGVFDNFFELGGHSLIGTQLMSRVRQSFEVDLPLRALFEARTVAGLAEKINDRRAELVLASLEGLEEHEIEAELSRRLNEIRN